MKWGISSASDNSIVYYEEDNKVIYCIKKCITKTKYVVIPVKEAQDLDSCYFQQSKSWEGACPAYNICILQMLDVQPFQENLPSRWYTCIKIFISHQEYQLLYACLAFYRGKY